MTIEDIQSALRKAVGERRQLDVALEADVSQAHISQVLNGGADPSPRLLAFLGFERIVEYRAIEKAEAAS